MIMTGDECDYVCLCAAIMLRCLQAIALLVPDLKMYFQNRLSKQQHVLLCQFDTVTMVTRGDIVD